MKNITFKYSLIIIISIVISFLFTSCEKVIDIDLNSSSPVLSIDGKMEKDSLAWVRLSYTSDYFNNESPKYLEDALVIISNSKGEMEEFQYFGEGVYRGQNMLGESDETYTLSVEDDNDIHVANSELFAPTQIIDVTFSKSVFSNPHSDKVKYMPTIKFTDDRNRSNYYMLRFWKNDTLTRTSYTTIEDKYFIDNDTIVYDAFRNNVEPGDHLKIRIYSIDKETDTYYSQLNDNQGGGGMSGTPYNPRSNFGYDVMGYFTARSYDEIETIVSIVEPK